MGYVSDIVTDIAFDFLENKRDKEKPFLLMLHHKAPHRTWQPAPRHLKMYDDVVFSEPDNLFDDYSSRSETAGDQEMTLKDHMRIAEDLKMGPLPKRLNDSQRAAWEAAYGPKRKAFEIENPEGKDLVRWKYQRYMQDYLGCIAGVDENVGRVLDYLEESGLEENTLVVYTSDQGFYLGDHGWFDKRFMYEESLRMPLLVKFPGSVSSCSVNQELVVNLDFAPTFLEMAGIVKPSDMQGESLKKLLIEQTNFPWRDSIYYHYYEFPAVHQVKRHYGIRTKKYKLIHFYHDIDAWELYDLEEDPKEMRNVYDFPDYSDIAGKLKTELSRLQQFYGDSDDLAQQFLQADLDRRRQPKK